MTPLTPGSSDKPKDGDHEAGAREPEPWRSQTTEARNRRHPSA